MCLKMSIAYCSVPISTHDPIPLDNPKNHTKLPYITLIPAKFATGSALYQVQNGKPKLCLCKQMIARSGKELLYNRTGDVWFGH